MKRVQKILNLPFHQTKITRHLFISIWTTRQSIKRQLLRDNFPFFLPFYIYIYIYRLRRIHQIVFLNRILCFYKRQKKGQECQQLNYNEWICIRKQAKWSEKQLQLLIHCIWFCFSSSFPGNVIFYFLFFSGRHKADD